MNRDWRNGAQQVLFPGGGLPAWFRGSRPIQVARVLSGFHPVVPHRLRADETCGSCARLTRNRSAYKCSLRNTACAETDVRLRWRACELWLRRDGPP